MTVLVGSSMRFTAPLMQAAERRITKVKSSDDTSVTYSDTPSELIVTQCLCYVVLKSCMKVELA